MPREREVLRNEQSKYKDHRSIYLDMASSVPCGPCGHDSIKKNAEKWCTDCNEGFCNVCEKAHRAMKMSRYHNFIQIGDYREIENVKVCLECKEHGSKLEMYCKLHEMPICLACFPAKHKSCSDAIIPLAEAAKNAKTSTSLADLEHTINNTIGNIRECVKDREAAKEKMETQEIRIKKLISITRQNINDRLDDLERKLLNDLSTTYSSCTSKYQNTHQMNIEIHNEVKAIQEAISSIDNYNIEIEIHQGITSLLKDVDCFAKIKVDNRTISFPFKDAKIDQAQLPAQIRRSVHNTRLELRKKITIKQNGKTMYISGCTILSNGNLLIADSNGHNVLLEYNDDGTFIREIPISGRPYCLSLVDTDYIAVSYGVKGYIEIIDYNKIIVIKSIKLKNSCWGISYSDGKIYVVVRGEGIVVLDMEGTILCAIMCNIANVFNITTSKTRIYYTESNQNTVYCCSSNGEEIWSFKDKSLLFSEGIAVDPDQNVFVVGFKSNNLLMLQDDGKVSKTLLTEADGIQNPTRVFYNKEKSLLLDIILIGDFNSRTAMKADYIENDSDEINNFDGIDLLPESYITDIDIRRVNQDSTLNTLGNKLLELCSSSRLRILNGRFLGDSLGYFTYMCNTGFSTVDYAIASESLLPEVKYFKTNDFTYLSDHVQINLYMNCSIISDTCMKKCLDEKRWHLIKSYKWTELSFSKLIDVLSKDIVKRKF
ncbi:unnamed protein product [Mytilus edulis]|uniref:B box-type domain-containing protein n=1 Tax=Mytilus edulis TaxID=6550 RepID=A0A8S3RGP4_MYTED|nr:unnamed protein product [Mytilus edulis]